MFSRSAELRPERFSAAALNHSGSVLPTKGPLDDHLHRLQLTLFIRDGASRNVDLQRNVRDNLRGDPKKSRQAL